MDLISHHTPQAMDKLQRAVDLGSAAAAATLANILIRVDPTPLTAAMPLSGSPDTVAPALSTTRPTLPARQPSNVFAHAAHSHRKTDESLRATDLYLHGLEIELRKPVQEELVRGEEVVESGYGSGSDEEYGAEGRFFSLERALDLVVGVTDSHRFGILHAPTPVSTTHSSSSPPSEEPDDRNDELWERSAKAAAKVLQHPLIAPIVESASSPPFVDVTSSKIAAENPRPSSKRRPSVARSYTHAASTIPDSPRPSGLPASFPPPPHLTPNRKLQLTIAIHALYTLALQAHSSPSSSPAHALPAAPQPLAAAESHWLTISRLAAPYAPQGGIGIKEGDELVLRALHRLESARHQDQGANEPWRLAKHAKKREGAIAAPPVLATGGGAARDCCQIQPGGVWEGEPASVMTIRPAARRGGSSGSGGAGQGGLFGGETPRAIGGGGKFHFASAAEDDLAEDEQEQEHDQEADTEAAGDSAFALSPPSSLLTSPLRVDLSNNGGSGSSAGPTAAARLAASQEYPSPPDTPPLEPGHKLFNPTGDGLVPPESGSTAVTAKKPGSSLSPLSATAPVFVPSSSSASSFSAAPSTDPSSTAATSTSFSALPRAPSTYSFASSYRSTGGASVLSSFSYNPLQAYLSGRTHNKKRGGSGGIRRVESSTSVCTAPPDFEREGARRFSRRDKGKGRALDGEVPASGFASPLAGPSALESVTGAAGAPKTWLSRFWATTKGAVADLKEGGIDGLERTRSSSAVDELQRALERHEEACDVVLSYWGEREFLEDEETGEETGEEGEVVEEQEEEEEDGARRSPGSGPASPPPPRRGASEITIRPTNVTFADSDAAAATAKAQLRPPPFARQDTNSSIKTVGSTKSAKSKRSFLLEDPTTRSSTSQRHSRRHSRNVSSTSSVASLTPSITTIDGHLAPPSPSKAVSSASLAPKPVAIDPLLLELERRSHVGIKTVCGACRKRGLNFPACRSCKKTYCTRECRVSEAHPCVAQRSAQA
ncbi:hypothetical protein JCM6882_009009 [Rhodosporidiobolus microsporus]